MGGGQLGDLGALAVVFEFNKMIANRRTMNTWHWESCPVLGEYAKERGTESSPLFIVQILFNLLKHSGNYTRLLL
jgi:hypothetical protein